MNIVFVLIAGVYLNINAVSALTPYNQDRYCSVRMNDGAEFHIQIKAPCKTVMDKIKNAALEAIE